MLKPTLLALSIAVLASASPIQQPVTCPTMQGAYCDSMQPDLEGQMFYLSGQSRGIIEWLSPEAETDRVVYNGPVVALDQQDFYVVGIPGMFSLVVDQSPAVDGGSQVVAAPEPNAWALIIVGLIGVAIAMRVRGR